MTFQPGDIVRCYFSALARKHSRTYAAAYGVVARVEDVLGGYETPTYSVIPLEGDGCPLVAFSYELKLAAEGIFLGEGDDV